MVDAIPDDDERADMRPINRARPARGEEEAKGKRGLKRKGSKRGKQNKERKIHAINKLTFQKFDSILQKKNYPLQVRQAMAREYGANMNQLKRKLIKSLIYEQNSELLVIDEQSNEDSSMKASDDIPDPADLERPPREKCMGLLSSCPEKSFKSRIRSGQSKGVSHKSIAIRFKSIVSFNVKAL